MKKLKRIKVQQIMRIRTLDEEIFDVRVKDICVMDVPSEYDFPNVVIDFDYFTERISSYHLTEGTYFISFVDSEERYMHYFATMEIDASGYTEIYEDEEDIFFCDLANEPKSDIEKIGMLIPVISKYGMTDYVMDMLEAKIHNL